MSAATLDATFAALSDPTRRAILTRLAAGEATVKELAAPFAISLPAISKHLKVLERAGLIVRSRHAQCRPCRITANALRDVDEWIRSYRDFWEERLDQLDLYVGELSAERVVRDSSPEERDNEQE